MYLKFIKNDIRNSKVVTMTISLFIVSASLMLSLAVILFINLNGSMENLLIKSKTPHFMQMHSGDIDFERLKDYSQSDNRIDEYQVVEFLNIDGSEIVIGDTSLSDSVQDNGFTIQNSHFDYLLNIDGEIINVNPGEVYLPLCYYKDGRAQIGESLSVGDYKFIIKGFLRDSQMNSSLASSKRFLLNREDYNKISHIGIPEYLIEFRLKDISTLATFQNDYMNSELESNGPTLTLPLFRFINAMSDGILIGVIILITILLVIISLMCIRFSLLTQIEDDYREIGVMKAIGILLKDIKKIYLGKYIFLILASSLAGILLSRLFKERVTENIRLFMGESNSSLNDLYLSVLAVSLIILFILLFINSVLGKFKQISATEAIRFGVSINSNSSSKGFKLSKNRFLDTNIFLGIKDVITKKRVYLTKLLVLILSSFIITVPKNLYNTISSDKFITYMGVGKSDIRVDIQQVDSIREKAEEVKTRLLADKRVSRHTLLLTKSLMVKEESGSFIKIRSDIGNHMDFPINYSSGRAPLSENEIALSAMNANDLEKGIGESITVLRGNREKKLTITGIYSDFTNGGKTSKSLIEDSGGEVMAATLYLNLDSNTQAEDFIRSYLNEFPYAKISLINEYINQTFGNTINSISRASNISIVIAVLITLLITMLFMNMLLARERYSVGVMKAFGFSNRDIVIQFLSRFLFILFLGSILGVILGNTLGEGIAGALLSSRGASGFKFIIDPLSAYLINPLIMIIPVVLTSLFSASKIESIKISDSIKEQ